MNALSNDTFVLPQHKICIFFHYYVFTVKYGDRIFFKNSNIRLSPIVYFTPKQYYLNKQSFQISGFYSLM